MNYRCNGRFIYFYFIDNAPIISHIWIKDIVKKDCIKKMQMMID